MKNKSQREARRIRKIERLLKAARVDPYKTVVDKRFWIFDFLAAFIEWCDAQAFEEPQKAVERSFVALELAKRVADNHGLVRATALHGSAYRMQGKQRETETIFSEAEALAVEAKCPCCHGEVLRRRAVHLQHRRQFSESLLLLETALDKFSLDTACDPYAIGKAEVNRGVSLKYLNRAEEAMDSQYRALRLLDHRSPERFHLAALTNIAFILVDSDMASIQRAEYFIQQFRGKLKGVKNFTVVRVKLRWIHGLVCARLGERKRALQMLRKVKKSLIKLRQDNDAIAISADISALYCDTSKYHLISEVIRDSLSKLGSAVGDQVEALLTDVQKAAQRETAETRELILALRQKVNASIPCILVQEMPRNFASP